MERRTEHGGILVPSTPRTQVLELHPPPGGAHKARGNAGQRGGIPCRACAMGRPSELFRPRAGGSCRTAKSSCGLGDREPCSRCDWEFLGDDGSGAVGFGRQGVAADPPETSAESTAAPQRQGTARCDVLPADPVDEGLRRVIAAWPTLEGTLKDAVLALVSLTARGTGTEAK